MVRQSIIRHIPHDTAKQFNFLFHYNTLRGAKAL